MAWIKIGQAQKGKIFSVLHGEIFNILDYSDGIAWENPLVFGQISSIFFDNRYSKGFRAIINYLGGTTYSALGQSYGNEIDTSNNGGGWLYNVSQGGDGSAFGGITIVPGGSWNFGYMDNFSGYNINNYALIQGAWDLVGSMNLYMDSRPITSISFGVGNRQVQQRSFRPVDEGTLVYWNNTDKTMRVFPNIFRARWENKHSIINIFLNESLGVGV